MAIEKRFNEMIESVIKELQGSIYIVNVDHSMKCTCIQKGTGEPQKNCPKCLGTGHKIKIRDAKAVCQESSVVTTIRDTTKMVIARNYYMLASYKAERDDLIVDRNEVYLINEVKHYKSKYNKLIYRQCLAVLKKYDSNDFMKNFNKIVKGKV